jgi:hypothetical protein
MSNNAAGNGQPEPQPAGPDPSVAGGGESLTHKWRVPAITGAAGLALGIILGVGVSGILGGLAEDREQEAKASAADEAADASRTILPDAVRLCAADKEFAVEGDDGLSLTIDNKGEEDYLGGLSTRSMMCIFERLETPTAVIAHMEQTTSMDGRQTETWDNIEVSWSYHPDRGMDSVVTVSD